MEMAGEENGSVMSEDRIIEHDARITKYKIHMKPLYDQVKHRSFRSLQDDFDPAHKVYLDFFGRVFQIKTNSENIVSMIKAAGRWPLRASVSIARCK